MANAIVVAGLPLAETLDLQDLRDSCLSQAHALMLNTFGGAGEAFRGMSEDAQDNYLWAVFELLETAVHVRSEMVQRELAARDSAVKS